jgi:N-acetyl-anhydromuramyl-L-alanine amidase AmpD
MNIKQVEFPLSQYFQEEHKKKQIYLHHTAGGPSGENVFKHWANNVERVSTCVAISNDGTIVQGFSSKYWGYHLGLTSFPFKKFDVKYQSLDRISIGVEICNWGYLKPKDGKFYNYVNREVTDVIELDKPFKGYKYYHNYTDAQIESTRQLLKLWESRYGINIKYNEDIWDLCKRALAGENGVFTHNSVRKDKSDVYPHPGLISMLKSL